MARLTCYRIYAVREVMRVFCERSLPNTTKIPLDLRKSYLEF